MMDESKNNELTDKLVETRHKLYYSNSFLEQMSRNVRGPLYSIIEFSRIARDSVDDKVAVNHYLDQIGLSGHLMNESIDDIMAVRQIAMKSVSLHAEYIELDEFLDVLKNDISHLLTPTGIELLIKKQDLSDCVILADYSILFQVLRKMIRLTAQMMPSKSTICFEVTKNKMTEREAEISFKVSGSESVLTSSQLQSLTDEYEALEYDMYASIGSMDPMIVIIRFYAHEMGTDRVEAVSDPENGAAIALSLKFPIIDVKDYEAMNNRSYDFSRKRILVADDDEINLEIVDRLLRERGAEVITVRDGREALLTYRTEHGKFDLILLDVVMPDMDGLTVARQIRENTTIPSSKNVPIIAMTVNAFHENYEQSLKAGMNSHLVKPIDSGRLYNTLAEYI